MASKEDLLHFLDSQVFNPILHASPEDYGKSDRDNFREREPPKPRAAAHDLSQQHSTRILWWV
jgi:hypothetical protein